MIFATEAKSVATIFHHRWEIPNHIFPDVRQVQSEAFQGHSLNGGNYEVSWHYVFNIMELQEHQSNPPYIEVTSFILTAVIDSSNVSLKAIVELEPNYKMTGITAAGSEIGKISVKKRNFLNWQKTKTVLRIKFSLIEDPASQDSQLTENYMSLLTNEELSDVTIQVGPEKFYAQKAILSVRSPVFAAMFQSGMQEAKLNRLVVEDIEPEVFRELLRFIYVGKVERLKEMIHGLLAAADKYALDGLKTMCEGFLRGNITKDTVLETLKLADLYNAQQLKEQTIQFVCQNIKSLKKTDWNAFTDSHPNLVAAILSAMTID